MNRYDIAKGIPCPIPISAVPIERNIIKFIEQLLLPCELTPIQKFILKCFYNNKLDDSCNNIPIKDNSKLCEKEYLKYLYSQKMSNRHSINPSDTCPTISLLVSERDLPFSQGKICITCKSTLLSLMAIFETFKALLYTCPQNHYQIMEQNNINIECITSVLSPYLFLYIQNFLYSGHRHPLYDRMAKPNRETISFKTTTSIETNRPSGTVNIKNRAISPNSFRGTNALAFFLDDMNNIKDSKRLFQSIIPCIRPFKENGRIFITTDYPTDKNNIAQQLIVQALNNDPNILMLQIP